MTALLAVGTLTACGNVKETSEYRALAKQAASAKAENSDLVAENSDLNAQVEQDKSAYAELEGDLPTREQALKAEQAKLQTAQDTLKRDRVQVTVASKAVAARERKVGIVEHIIAANTIPGDGVYRVGQDMKPGTYRSVDNEDCYWSINNDANGNEIVNNGNVSGPGLVTVSAGKFFETSYCSAWVLQQ